MVVYLLCSDIDRVSADSRDLERTRKLEGILQDLQAPIMRLDSNMAKLCQEVEGIQNPP